MRYSHEELIRASGDKVTVKNCNERIKALKAKYTEISQITGIPEEPRRMSKPRVLKDDKLLTNSDSGGIIDSKDASTRGFAMSLRRTPTHILTLEEIESIIKDARDIEISEELLRFNEGRQTGFKDADGLIYIRGDILPDENSTTARDRMSVKAVLAHEYYGHYSNHPSQYEIGDWRDEFKASYDAAIKTPNLTQRERADLMIDAYDRAREAGIYIEYDEKARNIIYGF